MRKRCSEVIEINMRAKAAGNILKTMQKCIENTRYLKLNTQKELERYTELDDHLNVTLHD